MEVISCKLEGLCQDPSACQLRRTVNRRCQSLLYAITGTVSTSVGVLKDQRVRNKTLPSSRKRIVTLLVLEANFQLSAIQQHSNEMQSIPTMLQVLNIRTSKRYWQGLLDEAEYMDRVPGTLQALAPKPAKSFSYLCTNNRCSQPCISMLSMRKIAAKDLQHFRHSSHGHASRSPPSVKRRHVTECSTTKVSCR